jgi:protein translocase SEC61 complex gamma subunit
MGIRSFFESAARLLRSAEKPDWDSLWKSVKICVLGIAVLGGIGFIVRIISSTIQGSSL